LLDFDNDTIFLEPLNIYKSVDDPCPQILHEQILFGYIDTSIRPQSIIIQTDQTGRFYLPNLGYYKTDVKNDFLEFRFNENPLSSNIIYRNSNVSFTFEPVFKVEGTTIELIQHLDPMLTKKFNGHDGNKMADIEKAFLLHKHDIAIAVNLIRSASPWFFEMMQLSMRKFVAFYHPEMRSFAGPNTLGTSYFGIANDDANEVYFIEDIIHQCSHNILYFVTTNMKEYFVEDVEKEKISTYNLKESDNRKIYSAIHGAFSLYNIAVILSEILNKEILTDRKRHELIGRFSDNLKRFNKAISDIYYKSIYTEKGWELISLLSLASNDLNSTYGSFANSFNTSNQPYVFSFKSFLELNPLN
jgi:hypothetical protein